MDDFDAETFDMPDADTVRRHATVRNNPNFRCALARFDAESELLLTQFHRDRRAARDRLFDALLIDLAGD